MLKNGYTRTNWHFQGYHMQNSLDTFASRLCIMLIPPRRHRLEDILFLIQALDYFFFATFFTAAFLATAFVAAGVLAVALSSAFASGLTMFTNSTVKMRAS